MYRNNFLFEGLSDLETEEALAFFEAGTKKYKKGEFLLYNGEPVKWFGIVISGLVHVCNDDTEGNRLIYADVRAGHSFAESMCFLKVSESPVYILAAEDSEILWLSTVRINNPSYSDPFSRMMNNRFIALLARRTLSMNERIRILSQKSIRAKVLMLLNSYSDGKAHKVIELPFDRENMADFLGTDRSALSRELSAMKKEGLIDFHKNSFWIL